MSWKDLKIGIKLSIGFGSLIIMLLIASFVGFKGLSTLGHEQTGAVKRRRLQKQALSPFWQMPYSLVGPCGLSRVPHGATGRYYIPEAFGHYPITPGIAL